MKCASIIILLISSMQSYAEATPDFSSYISKVNVDQAEPIKQTPPSNITNDTPLKQAVSAPTTSSIPDKTILESATTQSNNREQTSITENIQQQIKAKSPVIKSPKDTTSTMQHPQLNTEPKPVKCSANDVLVKINNNSPFVMVFEDLDAKKNINISRSTKKQFCISAGNHVDGFIKNNMNKVIQKMPVQHLMWFTKSLIIDIDQQGQMDFDLTTRR